MVEVWDYFYILNLFRGRLLSWVSLESSVGKGTQSSRQEFKKHWPLDQGEGHQMLIDPSPVLTRVIVSSVVMGTQVRSWPQPRMRMGPGPVTVEV